MTSVSLRPGDVVVIMSPNRLSEQGYQRLSESVKRHFPGHEMVILEEGMTLGVVRKEKP